MTSEPQTGRLLGMRIVLGVGGGIAAYKAADLVRLLRKEGAEVQVILTAGGAEFVTPLLLQTLSGRPVATSLFDATQESTIGHIAMADWADVLLIAPATANLLAKLSCGLADDLLSTVALACKGKLLLAPAMNVNMWEHPAVQENLQRLQARGAAQVGPEAGELACGWVGMGRMSDPGAIVEAVVQLGPHGSPHLPLAGKHVLVTAGPTYEALDPVRFLGNRSSGKMGFALAEAAALLGATVTLVAGPVSLQVSRHRQAITRVNIESADQLAEQVLSRLERGALDVIVMAAAVADYRPTQVAPQKLKKSDDQQGLTLQLQRTKDILAMLGQRRAEQGTRRPLLVGFAAETEQVAVHAQAKLLKKNCDVIVANDVAEAGIGFGSDENRVTLYFAASHGSQIIEIPRASKAAVSQQIWAALIPRLPAP